MHQDEGLGWWEIFHRAAGVGSRTTWLCRNCSYNFTEPLRPHQHIDEAPEAKHIRPTDSLDRPGYCSKLEIHTIYEFIYWFVGH